MRIIKIFDAKNYENHWKRFKRDSARAIIFADNKLVMVQSDKYGDCKFPGGGIEKGESSIEALIRETKEETGLDIFPASIREYGKIILLRRGFEGEEIFEQDSLYYVCEVDCENISPLKQDKYEIEYGYKLVFVTVEEAIQANSKLLNNTNTSWVERELTVLYEIKANGAI